MLRNSPVSRWKSLYHLVLLPLLAVAACDAPTTEPPFELRPALERAETGTIEFTVRTQSGQPVPHAWVGLYDGQNAPTLRQANASGVVQFDVANGNYGFTAREIPPEWFTIRTLVPPGASPAPTGSFFGDLAAVVCGPEGSTPVFTVADYRSCLQLKPVRHQGALTSVQITLPPVVLRPVVVNGPDGNPLPNANVYLIETIPPDNEGETVPWQPEALGAGVETGFFKFFARTDGTGTAQLPGTAGQIEIYETVNGVQIAGTIEDLPAGGEPQTLGTSPVVCIDASAPPSTYSATYTVGVTRGVDFTSSMWAFAGQRGTFQQAVIPDRSRAAVVLFLNGSGNFTWQFRVRSGSTIETAYALVSCTNGTCSSTTRLQDGSQLTLAVQQPQLGKLFATLGGLPTGAEVWWSARSSGDAVPQGSSLHPFAAFSTCAVEQSFDGSFWCDT